MFPERVRPAELLPASANVVLATNSPNDVQTLRQRSEYFLREAVGGTTDTAIHRPPRGCREVRVQVPGHVDSPPPVRLYEVADVIWQRTREDEFTVRIWTGPGHCGSWNDPRELHNMPFDA